MAVYQVSTGGVVNAADVNQWYNLLTGATTDQPVTVANRIRATNTGASTACGFMGGTAGGPPTSGTFAAGDSVIDTAYGGRWTCTTGGTPGTWVPSMMPISTQTLGGAVSTVTFASIPQGFQNLWLIVSAQATGAVSATDISLRFNGDSGSNYTSITWDANNGSTNPTVNYSNAQTSMPWALAIPGASGWSSARIGGGQALIPKYSGSSVAKTLLSESIVTDGGSVWAARKRWGHWTSFAAITSIVLTCASGNFTVNSFFGLYGTP